MQTVAVMMDDGARGPVWKCEVCGMRLAFLSVMIAHLYVNHSVKSLTQSEASGVLTGTVPPEE